MSTPARKLSISVNPAGYGSIEIDGQRIPRLTGFDIKARAGELTEVSLHTRGTNLDMDSNGFVKIPAGLEETLLALGWTPPPNDP